MLAGPSSEGDKLTWATTFGVAIVLVAILAFAIGAAAGASRSNSEFIGLLIPLIGAVGSWVAGIGALGAALIALHLGRAQMALEMPRIEVSASGRWTLRLVNKGKLPVKVDVWSTFLVSAHGTSTFVLGLGSLEKKPDSSVLGFGESIAFHYAPEVVNDVARWVIDDCSGRCSDIQLIVSTPVRVFAFPLPSYMEHHLIHELQRIEGQAMSSS